MGDATCLCIVDPDGRVDYVCDLHQMMILANEEILVRWMHGELAQRLETMFAKLRTGYVSHTSVTRFRRRP